MRRTPKEGTTWHKVTYINQETGGKAWIEQDRKRMYIVISDPKGGYIVETSVNKPTYDPVTPVLAVAAILMMLARVVLLLIPA